MPPADIPPGPTSSIQSPSHVNKRHLVIVGVLSCICAALLIASLFASQENKKFLPISPSPSPTNIPVAQATAVISRPSGNWVQRTYPEQPTTSKENPWPEFSFSYPSTWKLQDTNTPTEGSAIYLNKDELTLIIILRPYNLDELVGGSCSFADIHPTEIPENEFDNYREIVKSVPKPYVVEGLVRWRVAHIMDRDDTYAFHRLCEYDPQHKLYFDITAAGMVTFQNFGKSKETENEYQQIIDSIHFQ